MILISREEAIKYLHSYATAIHCDSIYGWKYRYIFDPDEDFSCYKLYGCVIIKNNVLYYDNPHMTINIHQVSDEANICAAWQHALENEKDGGTKRTIMLYACAPLPDEISEFLGFRKFIRKGQEYQDSDIRKLTEQDNATIKRLCEDSLENDTHFGKCEAQTFYSWFDDLQQSELLGIFNDSTLSGIISVNIFKEVGLAQISDLFIHKNYRRHGFGKRLVKAALALYPKLEYFYQAAKQNEASIKLALSLDFKFAGAELYALNEE